MVLETEWKLVNVKGDRTVYEIKSKTVNYMTFSVNKDKDTYGDLGICNRKFIVMKT